MTIRTVLVFALLAGTALDVHANGRSPLTNGIELNPSDPQSLYVATTFGLLISHDNGCTFKWVCEQNIGYGGTFDPLYAVAKDGTIFATTFDGLRVSRDGGCSFTTATSELAADDPNRIANMWIDALDIGANGHVWVATADSTKPNNVYLSTDNGLTFGPKGMQSSTVYWKSVRVAPSDTQRVYAAGYEIAGNPRAHFLTTDDAGANWTESTLTNVQYGPTPLLLVKAVSKTNRDVLFVTSVQAAPPMGDRLYRSTDGGKTFEEVLTTTTPIADVVVRSDTHVIVAVGTGGSFQSTNGGSSFSLVANSPLLSCLGEAPNGELIGCGANWQPDFLSVGKSQDGVSWQKVFRFVELAGPLECPAGTAERDVCDVQLWPTMQQQFGIKSLEGCRATTDGALDGAMTSGSGGCCDAGSSSPIAAAWLSVLVLLGLRRRRT